MSDLNKFMMAEDLKIDKQEQRFIEQTNLIMEKHKLQKEFKKKKITNSPSMKPLKDVESNVRNIGSFDEQHNLNHND
jgi:hypothetical protein